MSESHAAPSSDDDAAAAREEKRLQDRLKDVARILVQLRDGGNQRSTPGSVIVTRDDARTLHSYISALRSGLEAQQHGATELRDRAHRARRAEGYL